MHGHPNLIIFINKDCKLIFKRILWSIEAFLLNSGFLICRNFMANFIIEEAVSFILVNSLIIIDISLL